LGLGILTEITPGSSVSRRQPGAEIRNTVGVGTGWTQAGTAALHSLLALVPRADIVFVGFGGALFSVGTGGPDEDAAVFDDFTIVRALEFVVVVVVEEDVVRVAPWVEEFGVGASVISEEAAFFVLGFFVGEKGHGLRAFTCWESWSQQRWHDVGFLISCGLFYRVDGLRVGQGELLVFFEECVASLSESFHCLHGT